MATHTTHTTTSQIPDSAALKKLVDAVKAEAAALPAEVVAEPRMPIDVFVKECLETVSQARAHKAALEMRGVNAEMIASLESKAKALEAQETLFHDEPAKKRTADTKALIADAEKARLDALDHGDVALEDSAAGLERLAHIREGTGLADLHQDLNDLVLLVTGAKPLFASVGYDVQVEAKKMADLAQKLQHALSEEGVEKSLSSSKDLRDRLYVLCLKPLGAIRRRARLAFRDDSSGERRGAFVSKYIRRKDQRRRGHAPATSATAPGAVNA